MYLINAITASIGIINITDITDININIPNIASNIFIPPFLGILTYITIVYKGWFYVS